MTSSERNEAIIRRYVEELNQRNIDVLNELVADDVTAHGVVGREQYRRQIEGRIEKYPDYHVTIERVVPEDDRVTLYWRRRGTSVDGESLDDSEFTIYRITDGQIIDVPYADNLPERMG